MIEVLITAVLVIFLFQPSWERRFPGLVLGLVAWANYAMCEGLNLTGFDYCLNSAVCGAVALFIVGKYSRITIVSDTVVAVCCASIVLNICAWPMYEFSIPLEPYYYSIAALYFIAILSLLRKDCANDYARITKRYRSIRLSFAKCGAFFKVLPKEAGL